ncbi:MAG: hypothetical protein HG467_001230 [Clostridiales bacterium]|nr:hypothetical protein [Clostridiales bacterium]
MEYNNYTDLEKVERDAKNLKISKEIEEKIKNKDFPKIEEDLEDVNVLSDMDGIVEYKGRIMSLSEYERIKEQENKG